MPTQHKTNGWDVLAFVVAVLFFLVLLVTLSALTALYLCTFGIYNKLTIGTFWP